jgi:hypothetical protein
MAMLVATRVTRRYTDIVCQTIALARLLVALALLVIALITLACALVFLTCSLALLRSRFTMKTPLRRRKYRLCVLPPSTYHSLRNRAHKRRFSVRWRSTIALKDLSFPDAIVQPAGFPAGSVFCPVQHGELGFPGVVVATLAGGWENGLFA